MTHSLLSWWSKRGNLPLTDHAHAPARSSDRWDGARAVAGLALSAPPPFADLAEGLDSAEVARNLEFLQSSLGRQLVKLLRSSFFSMVEPFARNSRENLRRWCCSTCLPPHKNRSHLSRRGVRDS